MQTNREIYYEQFVTGYNSTVKLKKVQGWWLTYFNGCSRILQQGQCRVLKCDCNALNNQMQFYIKVN